MISVKGFTFDSRGVEFYWLTKKIILQDSDGCISKHGSWHRGHFFGAEDPTQVFLRHILA